MSLRSERWFGGADLAGGPLRAVEDGDPVVLDVEALEHVLQADEGCDFDFLRARPGEREPTEPYGLLSGWVGGW